MFAISSGGFEIEDPSKFFEQENFLEDLLADCPILEGNDTNCNQKIAKTRPRKIVSSSNEVQENINDGCKKIVHRFKEKQRRQEMSALHTSLRSLLPLEYVKGKRGISDHMHQAVNYINDMKKKLGKMQKRRDELKKLCNVASTSSAEDSKTNIEDSTNYVKINVLRDGMEILIMSSSINKERLPLSKVFQDLLERNLNIINCVSSTIDSCFLHKIHVEIDDATSIDLLELQGQLENLIRFP